MTDPKKPLPRRGTQPYAVMHAREVAYRWEVSVNVARCGETFFCVLEGACLDDAELVGRAISGGKMFVYEGARAGLPAQGDVVDVSVRRRVSEALT